MTGPGDARPLRATFGRRAGGFALDCLIAALVAGLFTYPELPRNWSLLPWAVLTVLGTWLVGRTPGMALVGLRLAQTRPAARIGLGRSLLRTALLVVVVPALIMDRDGRGLHDRLSGTAVVRS